MVNIEESICEAIKIIVNKIVANLNYDRTIKAQIVRLKNAAAAQYIVKHQDNSFSAFALNPSFSFDPDQTVYILIPGNDWDARKIILGEVGNMSKENN